MGNVRVWSIPQIKSHFSDKGFDFNRIPLYTLKQENLIFSNLYFQEIEAFVCGLKMKNVYVFTAPKWTSKFMGDEGGVVAAVGRLKVLCSI